MHRAQAVVAGHQAVAPPGVADSTLDAAGSAAIAWVGTVAQGKVFNPSCACGTLPQCSRTADLKSTSSNREESPYVETSADRRGQLARGGTGTFEVDADHTALVALLRTRPNNLTWRKLTDQVIHAGSATTVWRTYHPVGLIPSSTDVAPLEDAGADLRKWDREGLTFLSALDANFPHRLRGIADTPPFLFARGSHKPDDASVAVVGSRTASARGIQLASAISEYLVAEGLTVVSGLAAGIDAVAHDAALRGGGRTVAFIATGLNKSYPAANRQLQRTIAERGLLLSQFWPDAPPQKQNFLHRNALIAGYGLAAIVVEAGEHSGARNLARQAVEQGRPLILTDLVTDANDWARQLLCVPGVYRAASLTKLAEILARIRSLKHLPRHGHAGEVE